MPATREVHQDGWRVRLGLSQQVLRLEVPEHWGRDLRFASALLPSLPYIPGCAVSAATLLLKAKQFDDGLFAAVELAAQRGAGRFAGKASLLGSLADGLRDAGHGAAALIHVACELGGIPAPVPDSLADAVRAARDNFLADAAASTPLGFYGWSPELTAIYRQDRLLQRPLDAGPAGELARAVSETPGAAEAYSACLRLNARLTNPPKLPGPEEAGMSPPFFPPSRSWEVSLLEGLYGDRPVPEGFDLMGELIRRVRSGDVRLKPGDDSGWYDHQTWSLEPLVAPDRAPERARLELGRRYRRHLEDLFRGAMALARETHAKQLAGGRGGYGGPRARPICVRPGLTVEPLPAVYARRAASYRFARSVLEEAFGAEALDRMHRLTPGGVLMANLADELDAVGQLFDGAAAASRSELGMETGPEDREGVGRFAAFVADLATDTDVGRDCRMMVPIFFDAQRRKTKVWTFLGWRGVPVEVEYRVEPTVLGIDRNGPGDAAPPPLLFTSERQEFAVPVMAEVYVTRLLGRDEFRQHCDRFRTREAILANLR